MKKLKCKKIKITDKKWILVFLDYYEWKKNGILAKSKFTFLRIFNL
jgi:hypothetical protein